MRFPGLPAFDARDGSSAKSGKVVSGKSPQVPQAAQSRPKTLFFGDPSLVGPRTILGVDLVEQRMGRCLEVAETNRISVVIDREPAEVRLARTAGGERGKRNDPRRQVTASQRQRSTACVNNPTDKQVGFVVLASTSMSCSDGSI